MADTPVTDSKLDEKAIGLSVRAGPSIGPDDVVTADTQNFVDFGVFDGPRAFDTQGFAENTVGRAGTSEVDEKKLDLIEAKKKREDARDQSIEHLHLGAELREARLAQVFDGLSEEALDFAVDETLKNIDEVAAKHNLNDQQKAELERLLIIAKTGTPEEKADALGKIAKEHPGVAADMAKKAEAYGLERKTGDLNAEENIVREANMLEDVEAFKAEASGFATDAAISRTVEARQGVSASGNPFDQVAFSPSAEFNAQALGDVAALDAEPVEARPVTTGPVLA